MNAKSEKMEITSKVLKNNKIYGSNVKMINGDNTESITTYNGCYFFLQEIPIVNEYSEFYYRYIDKFKELEGYLFSNLFCNYKKINYNFSSIPLQFGKSIIDWVIGKRFSNRIITTISK